MQLLISDANTVVSQRFSEENELLGLETRI